MKTYLKTEEIITVVAFWVCENPLHRHKTEDVAIACINKPKHKIKPNIWTPEEYDKVIKRKESGETYTAIGKDYNVCCTQMRQVILKGYRIRKNPDLSAPYRELKSKTLGALGRLVDGMPTPEKIRPLMNNGELENIPNIGKNTLIEIEKWLIKHNV